MRIRHVWKLSESLVIWWQPKPILAFEKVVFKRTFYLFPNQIADLLREGFIYYGSLRGKDGDQAVRERQKDRETGQGDICFPPGPQGLGVWREFLSSIHKDDSDFLRDLWT